MHLLLRLHPGGTFVVWIFFSVRLNQEERRKRWWWWLQDDIKIGLRLATLNKTFKVKIMQKEKHKWRRRRKRTIVKRDPFISFSPGLLPTPSLFLLSFFFFFSRSHRQYMSVCGRLIDQEAPTNNIQRNPQRPRELQLITALEIVDGDRCCVDDDDGTPKKQKEWWKKSLLVPGTV